MNIRINLILPEIRAIKLHAYLLLKIFVMGSENVYFETECVMVVRGHPRSLILISVENAYATSY